MIYKRKTSISPTVIALVAVIASAGILTTAIMQPSSSSTTVAAVAATGDPNLTATVNTGAATTSANIGALNADEVALQSDIQQINSINLDTSVLQNPTFMSFVNFVQPVQETIGRPDPFAPINGLVTTNPSSSPTGH